MRTLYDPAAGTGGMLSVAEEYLRELNPDAELKVFGQELNAESYAICKSDMMIKGQNPENIVRGNSFSEDGHVGEQVRLHAVEPALRRGVEEGPEGGRGRARDAGLRGPLRAGAAADQRRVAAVPAAHDLEDEAGRPEDGRGREPARHRASTARRSSPATRGRGERDPAVDHRERLAGGDRRAAGPALLQHRDLDLPLDRDQPEAGGAQGEGAARQRGRAVPEDAQVAGEQAERAGQGAHRDDRRGRTGDVRRRASICEGLRQRGLRLPADHGRAPAAAQLPGVARADRAAARRRARSRGSRGRRRRGRRGSAEVEAGARAAGGDPSRRCGGSMGERW